MKVFNVHFLEEKALYSGQKSLWWGGEGAGQLPLSYNVKKKLDYVA